MVMAAVITDHFLLTSAVRMIVNRYPRISFSYAAESSFKQLFDSTNEQALLNATGVDHRTFNKMLASSRPSFDRDILDEKTGLIRRKKLPMLALTSANVYRGRQRCWLSWFDIALVSSYGCCEQFASAYLWFEPNTNGEMVTTCERCLFLAQQQNKPALPSREDVEAYKEALSAKYPHAQDVGFAADGFKLQ